MFVLYFSGVLKMLNQPCARRRKCGCEHGCGGGRGSGYGSADAVARRLGTFTLHLNSAAASAQQSFAQSTEPKTTIRVFAFEYSLSPHFDLTNNN